MIVAGVLFSIAAPNFSEVMLNSKQSVMTNELMSSLRIARSEAIKSSTRTAVCARDTDTSCGSSWNNGFIAFVDNGANAGVIDDGERILKVAEGVEKGGWILNKARLVNTNAAPIQRNFIRFGPRGTSHWRGSGFFAICDKRGQESARAINISLSGDPRRGTGEDASGGGGGGGGGGTGLGGGI